MITKQKTCVYILVCSFVFCCSTIAGTRNTVQTEYSKVWYDSDLKLLVTFYSKEAAGPIEAINWHLLNGRVCSISPNGVADFKWSSESVSTYLYRRLQNIFPSYDEYFGGRKTIAVLLDSSMNIIESRIVAMPLQYYKNESKFGKQIDSVFADFGLKSKGMWVKKVPSSEEEYYVGFISAWCY